MDLDDVLAATFTLVAPHPTELDHPPDPRGRIRQHEGPKQRRDTVGRLLKQQGYRLQRTVKTLRAPSIPTVTPSSATSTSRPGSTLAPGSRW